MYAKILGLSTVAVLTATSAMATTDATATTDLNLRSLPDPRGEILDVIPGEAMVQIEQCTTDTTWCKVNYDGTEGWAYSPYLTASLDEEPVVIYENVERFEVESVDLNDDDRAAAAAAGGPAAIAGAVALGTIAGAESVPEQTVTYVQSNPLDPVYVNGEVVVGAGIPQEVELVTIPESDYRYVYLNGTPVLVDEDRVIVNVVR